MLRNEDLLQVMNEAFDRYDEEAVQTLDGRKLAIARAVEQAAYAAAIKACEAHADHEEEARALQSADAARGGDEQDELARLRHLSDVRLFNAGISKCADAIRSLMEQPK